MWGMINNCRPLWIFLLLVLIGGEISARLFMHPGSKFMGKVSTWSVPGSTSLCQCKNQCLVQPMCTAVSVQLDENGIQCLFTSEPATGIYLENSNASAVFIVSDGSDLSTTSEPSPSSSDSTPKTSLLETSSTDLTSQPTTISRTFPGKPDFPDQTLQSGQVFQWETANQNSSSLSAMQPNQNSHP
ncbi:uncharacterized protein LOC122253717 [Penaeus japonicus]|uniref:uncharacterized protein LOC122253717 n=1 Tax=Penaeus japonicus TaxID=27405 RepID=UPI001C70C465|nr:uncharacterized protein LOC122253717 [Penaeus japonicus]